MEALIGLFIGTVMLEIGLLIFGVGVAVTFLFSLIIKRKRRLGKALVIISAIISCMVLFLTIALFVPILLSYTEPPSDFVMTDTPIEWRGEFDECFVADGQVYVRLDEIAHHYEVCKEHMTPVFHHQPDELLLRFRSYNCYAIENEHGFELIYADSDLYCPEEQLDSVVSYYLGEQKFSYYVYEEGLLYDPETHTQFGEHYRMNGRTPELLDELFLYDIEGFPINYITDVDGKHEVVYVVITSADGIVIWDRIELMVTNSRIYILEHPIWQSDAWKYKCRAIPEDVEWRLYEAMIFDGIIEPEATDDLERN